MIKKLACALLMTGLAFAPGCTPSPEKVCSSFADLAEKEMKDSDDSPKKMSAADKKDGLDKCVKELSKIKEKNPDAYKTGAKCIVDATKMDAAFKCYMKLAMPDDSADDDAPKKKKKGDDDSADDSSKKKKKKSDDDSADDAPKKKKASDDDSTDDAPKKKKKPADDDDK